MAQYILNDLLVLKNKLASYISIKSRLFLNSKKYQFANYNNLKEELNKSFTYQRLVDDTIDLNYQNSNYNPDNFILLTSPDTMKILGYAEQLTINY